MPPEQGNGFMLDESDRLPWLEPAEPIEDMGSVPLRKLVLLVLLFLVLLSAVVGVGWWYKSRSDAAAEGEATLIAAPDGPYKIPASAAAGKGLDVDGKEFDGTGDESYSTSEGGNAMGRIDASRAPEMPMADLASPRAAPAARPAPPPAKGTSSARIADATVPRTAAPPAAAPAAVPSPAATGQAGPQVQLGAYDSEATAELAWKRLVERFEELSGSNHRIEPVVTGGRTLFRLRMSVASAAEGRSLCGRLRIAGERCWAVQ